MIFTGSGGTRPPRDYDWNPLDPATRVIDALGREWAVKSNGAWAALGEAVSADDYTQLAAKFGPVEVRG